MQERPKAGRKVDLSRSRKEQRTPRAPKEPREPKEKRRVTFWSVLGRLIATVVCLCIIGGSLLAVGPCTMWSMLQPTTAICWTWTTLS